MCVCVLSSHLFWTSNLWTHQPWSHTGGGSHRISPPSFCGAYLNSYREEDLAAPFPRRPRNRISNFVYPRIDRSLYSCWACFFCVCVCVLSSHLFRTSGLWTYLLGSHRKKVAQDFSAFLLRCLPSFFSREEFSRSFPSSTVRSNFVYSCTNDLS